MKFLRNIVACCETPPEAPSVQERKTNVPPGSRPTHLPKLTCFTQSAPATCIALLTQWLLSLSPAFASDHLTSPSAPTARVVIVEDSFATEAFRPRANRVQIMVNAGVTNLARTADLKSAWLSLVSPRDTVGIKVFSAPGPNSGTRPAVVSAIIEGLLSAGLPPRRIVIWDTRLTDLLLAGFSDVAKKYGVRLTSSTQAGYDEKVYYEKPFVGNPVWGDLEFGRKGPGIGRNSYFSKLLTKEISKIINVTPLLNHDLAGVSGTLYGLAMASTDNIGRFESDPDRLAVAVPEIYGTTNLHDHVVLNITDALICQYEGGERGLLHYSTALNQLRFSKDPVALDVLSIDELERQRKAADAPAIKINRELYSNASLLELGVSDLKKISVEKVVLQR